MNILDAIVEFFQKLFGSAESTSQSGTSTSSSPARRTLSSTLSRVWRNYDRMFQKYGADYGVDWKWLKAIALNESALGTHAAVAAGKISDDGKSWGLMQFILPTARDMLGWSWATDAEIIGALNDPETSIKLAAKYIFSLSKQFPGDRRKIIMSYNQGPGNTKAGKQYAAEYYERFERNLKLVEDNL